METIEILDRIFKDLATPYELTEFENLGKPIHDIFSIDLLKQAKIHVEQLIQKVAQV
jgi:hypothetical protein